MLGSSRARGADAFALLVSESHELAVTRPGWWGPGSCVVYAWARAHSWRICGIAWGTASATAVYLSTPWATSCRITLPSVAFRRGLGGVAGVHGGLPQRGQSAGDRLGGVIRQGADGAGGRRSSCLRLGRVGAGAGCQSEDTPLWTVRNRRRIRTPRVPAHSPTPAALRAHHDTATSGEIGPRPAGPSPRARGRHNHSGTPIGAYRTIPAARGRRSEIAARHRRPGTIPACAGPTPRCIAAS